MSVDARLAIGTGPEPTILACLKGLQKVLADLEQSRSAIEFATKLQSLMILSVKFSKKSLN